METNLDYDSSIPLYAQIVTRLQQDIENGAFHQTRRLPTEVELAQRYNVSRITIRRSVDELVAQGLVEKKQGKGTFLCTKKISRHLDTGPIGFTEMCEANGLVPSAKLLEAGICCPESAETRQMLQLPEGGKAVKIRRLRCADGKPLALEESFYPLEYSDLLSIDLEKQSTYQYLRDVRGIELRSTTIRLSIVRADAKLAKLLQVARNTPQLEMKGRVVRPDGQTVHSSYQIGYGENFEFVIR